jgi:dCMP deaminase
MCFLVAKRSKDKTTKVGCVIVGPDHEVRATGYNGFPRGVDDSKEDWRNPPKKYLVTAHAELNAVCSAARVGTPLLGCTAYVTLIPCSACALALIQAGIKEIRVAGKTETGNPSHWEDKFEATKELLEATNISLKFL